MNWKILKTVSFWLGFAIYMVSVIIAIMSLSEDKLHAFLRLPLIMLCSLLYFALEFSKATAFNRLNTQKNVCQKLACVDTLKFLSRNQNLRSNIFLFDKKKKNYRIVEHYNMAADDDANIEIPENMGCTGEAWRTSSQVWGDKDHILHEGDKKISIDQARKVREDLEWICSTPIIKEGKVIAALNFDGNQKMDASQKSMIKNHANRVAKELCEVDFSWY